MRGVSLAAALVAALVWVGAGSAAPDPVVVMDEAGDNEDAPDVVEASVVADRAGNLVFRVRLAGAPELTPGDRLVSILIDADRDETTGPEAMEFAVRFDAAGARLEAWIDAMYQRDEYAALTGAYAGGLVTVSVPRASLGRTRALDFRVVSSEGDVDVEGTTDSAPDLEPATYTVPGPRRVEAVFRPQMPRAGARFGAFSTRVVLSDGSSEVAVGVTCTARIAGRLLRPAGRCAWRIPSGTAGRTLVVTVRATWGGDAAPARTYRLGIR